MLSSGDWPESIGITWGVGGSASTETRTAEYPLERAVSAEKEELTEATNRGDQQRRTWYIAFAVLAAGIVLAAALILGIERRLDSRLNEADARVADAKRQADTAATLANQKVAATQEDARRQIDEARQTAEKAQVVSEVLASPDLIRFTLTSRADELRASSHLLWSRSRGLVFSGLRLPPVPAQHTYQLWLLTNGEPVSAGLFVPDAAGMATVIVPGPPRVPRPVVGASVTVEPFGGSAAPSDRCAQLAARTERHGLGRALQH
jgi:anti-sigma-K factor RskA